MVMTIGLDPVLWRWGPLTLTWHGLFLTAGLALGFWIFLRRAVAEGLPGEPLVELLVWTTLGGYGGARLLQVLLYDWPTYAARPLRMLALHEGGLAWYGGLIGGAAAVAAVAWRKRLPFWLLADAAAFGVAAGLIVGRIGCMIAGDVVGAATGEAWGLVYTHPGASVPPDLLGVPTFPAPLAMMAGNALLLGLLLALRRQPRLPGTLFLLYVAGYGVMRFVLSFWQVERVLFLGLHPTQVIAAVLGVGAALALLVRCRAATG